MVTTIIAQNCELPKEVTSVSHFVTEHFNFEEKPQSVILECILDKQLILTNKDKQVFKFIPRAELAQRLMPDQKFSMSPSWENNGSYIVYQIIGSANGKNPKKRFYGIAYEIDRSNKNGS